MSNNHSRTNTVADKVVANRKLSATTLRSWPMLSRIVYYDIKERFKYIVPLPLALGLAMGMLTYTLAAKIGAWPSVFLAMLVATAWLVLIPRLFKSDVFAFSMPIDPRLILDSRFLAELLASALFFAIYMPIAFPRPLDSLVISIIASAVALNAFVYIYSFLSLETRKAWVILPIAAALLALEIAYYSPISALLLPSISVLVYLLLREYYANELYTNFYDLVEKPLQRPTVTPELVQGNLWRLALNTTYIFSGKKTLASTLSISTVGATALLIASSYRQPLAEITGASAFFLFLLMLLSLSSGVRFDRYLTALSADDRYAYMKYKTAARTLASLVATLPWIAAYATIWLYFGHLPAAYVLASLALALLISPVLAWPIGALSKPRRVPTRRRSLRGPLLQILLSAGASILLLLLVRFWPLALVVSAIFYAVLFTRFGKGIWARLANMLEINQV